MRQLLSDFLCCLFGHRWQLRKRNVLSGVYECTRCRRWTQQPLPPFHPNCRCIITPTSESSSGQRKERTDGIS